MAEQNEDRTIRIELEFSGTRTYKDEVRRICGLNRNTYRTVIAEISQDEDENSQFVQELKASRRKNTLTTYCAKKIIRHVYEGMGLFVKFRMTARA